MDYSEFSDEEYFEQDMGYYGKPVEFVVAYAMLTGAWDNLFDHLYFSIT